MENLDEKDLEFGAIDNDGDIALLDDEELNLNTVGNDEEGISFESIIGEAETDEPTMPIISTYSTQELNELEKMISDSEESKERELENTSDNFMPQADDNEFDVNKDYTNEDLTETDLDNVLNNIEDENSELEPLENMANVSEEATEPETEEVEETENDVEETVEPETEKVEEEVSEVTEEAEPEVEETTEEAEDNKEEKIDFNDLESTGVTMDLENIKDMDVEEDLSPFTTETFEDPMDDVNMDALLDKASKNAQEASNIFNQNLELRRQIDERYNELLKLTEEQEKAKNAALEEIENYKNDVYEKLKNQKTDVEAKIAELKLIQNSIEQDKENFEKYRIAEIDKINNLQKENEAKLEQERAAIADIEEKLVLRKTRLDQEREQIKIEREKFEQEKRNLQSNLRKFNELVGGFTNGIDQFTNPKTNETENNTNEG